MRRKVHLAQDEEKAYCGRFRNTGIECLVGKPKPGLRRYLCVRCHDRYWKMPTSQRFTNRG